MGVIQHDSPDEGDAAPVVAQGRKAIGTYSDGRALHFDEATGQFDIGGTSVTVDQVVGYDRAGHVFWQRDEMRSWAHEYAAAMAPRAPGAGQPQPAVGIDVQGAWCPHCQNRNSVKHTSGFGCVFWIVVLVSLGLGLIMIPFLPKTWRCLVCGNEWRA
jgi:hypothetical protein